MNELLQSAAARAARYRDGLVTRAVAPSAEALAGLARFDEPFPDGSCDPREVLALLDVIAAIQAEGTCWAGGTVWQGRTAMRISVSSCATTDDDVERSLAAIVRVAADTIGARG